jgi:hypothetical protein
MADEVRQLNPEAFASLAGKVAGLMSQLSPDERALLQVIMGLAEETLAAASAEVSGYMVNNLQVPALQQLRTGFQQAFGPFVPGFGTATEGRLSAYSI